MTKLLKYQRQGVRQIHCFDGRALLADDMGLGKSIQALTFAQEAKAFPMVIVCPAFVKNHWKREALLHMNLRCEILDGRTIPKRRGFISSSKVLIVNYDILDAWLPYIQELEPQLVVIDECQYISNFRTKRAKLVRKLCHRVPNVLGLSGTPLTNRPAELWTILNLIHPTLFPSFYRYAERYCQPRRRPWGMEFKGATRLPELHRITKDVCMIRRLKEDVLKDLPPKSRFIIPLEITGRKEYREAVTNFASWVHKHGGPARAKRALKAEALTKVGYLKRLAARLKTDSVISWVDNWLEDSDGKIILFGIHKSIIKVLREEYHSRCVVIDGSVPKHARQRVVDQFNHSKRTRICIANMQAGGVGWNGTSASTAAFFEIGWTPGEHSQCEDRIYRIGQKLKTTVYYLVATNTVEEKLCELLQKKQKILEATLDGTVSKLRLDIFDELMKTLIRSAE